jgi:lysozyme
MNISDAALEHIKHYEGFSSVPYLCPAEVWTIGYGHTQGVNAYTIPITKETAHEYLREDVRATENAILELVHVALNQSQYDALVSLIFNIGEGNFRRSTLLKKLNCADFEGAADEFLRWVYGGGRKIRGLEKRRKAEREMFLSS